MISTIVCSDLHIGYERTNYDKIRELFEIAESKASTFILNGDIFDCWRMEWNLINSVHKEEIQTLEQLSHKIDIEYVLGNHDYTMRRNRFPNINFHRKSFDFGNYHAEHGDRFDIIQRRWGQIINLIIQLYPPLYQRFFKSPSETYPIDNNVATLPMHLEASKFGKKIGKYVIVGHSHQPQIFDNVIDCGDMINSFTYIVIEDGVHSIEQIK